MIVKKIHINYKIYSQTSIFFIVCIYHNRQYNDGWKSSINLKLVIFVAIQLNLYSAYLWILLTHVTVDFDKSYLILQKLEKYENKLIKCIFSFPSYKKSSQNCETSPIRGQSK
jgi:hypothetical protein